MNTKGVEDGISDEQLSAKQRVLARWDRAYPRQACVGSPWIQICDERMGTLGASETEQAAWKDADIRTAAVPEPPTFANQLSAYLTRNGGDEGHMGADISLFMHVNGWQAVRKL